MCEEIRRSDECLKRLWRMSTKVWRAFKKVRQDVRHIRNTSALGPNNDCTNFEHGLNRVAHILEQVSNSSEQCRTQRGKGRTTFGTCWKSLETNPDMSDKCWRCQTNVRQGMNLMRNISFSLPFSPSLFPFPHIYIHLFPKWSRL